MAVSRLTIAVNRFKEQEVAETKRQHAKIKHTLCEHLIPETAEFGTVWCARDTGAIWYATRSGVVVNLTDVLNGVVAHTPPRHGKDGIDGRDGAKGDPGRAAVGIQGPPGRDAVGIQGPPGINVKGDKGDRGEASTVPGPDTSTVLAAARAEIAAIHAEFADLKLTVQAIHEMNRQADEYIAYLKAKVATRAEIE
jgi:hypothetical protein